MLYRRYWPVLLVAFICMAVGFSVLPIRNAIVKPLENKDYTTWFETGQLVLQGQPLYPTEPDVQFPYMYPPLAAIAIFAPLSAAGHLGVVLGMVLLNTCAWLASILLSVRLATGRVAGAHPFLYMLSFGCTIPFVWDTYFLGQLNIVLLALMLGAFNLLPRRSVGGQMGAGMLIALAAAMKAFPILAVPYLVWRRHWTALGALAAGLVLFLVVFPAPIRGFNRNLAELNTWAQGMVLENKADMIGQRAGVAFAFNNQSLLSIAHRLLRDIEAGNGDGEPFRINLASLSPGAVQAVFILVAAGAGLMFLWAMPRRRSPARSTLTDALEQSILLILIVLFTPLAWTYFFCWLMPAFAAALRFLSLYDADTPIGRRSLVYLFLSIAVLLLALTQNWDQRLQAVGITALGSVALILTLGWMLRTCVRSPPPPRVPIAS